MEERQCREKPRFPYKSHQGQIRWEVGIKWAIRQCDELLSGGAPAVHFYIMRRAYPVKTVVEALRKMA